LLLIIQTQSSPASTPTTIYFLACTYKSTEKRTYTLLHILSDTALKTILFKTFLSGTHNTEDYSKSHTDRLH